MKTIRSWDDLRPYGIDVLTGEACGLSYRLLCDVTAAGKKVLEKAFGLKTLGLAETWNRGSPEEPHLGSILLVPELLEPIGIFALLENGCTEVWRLRSGGLVGITPTDSPEAIASFQKTYASDLGRRFRYGGTAGDRNLHLMSGRIQ